MKKLLLVGLLIGSHVSYGSDWALKKADMTQKVGAVVFGIGTYINVLGMITLSECSNTTENDETITRILMSEWGTGFMALGASAMTYGTVQKRVILQERANSELPLSNTNPLNVNLLQNDENA